MKYTKVVSIGGNEYAILPDGTHRRVATYYGSTSRVRPKYADGARDADTLLEADTGKVCVFDEEIDDWREIKGGS